jgi:hypothetical protein
VNSEKGTCIGPSNSTIGKPEKECLPYSNTTTEKTKTNDFTSGLCLQPIHVCGETRLEMYGLDETAIKRTYKKICDATSGFGNLKLY